MSEAFFFYLQLQKLSINTRAGGDDDLGQLQDLKSDITEFSISPTTIRSPGKSKKSKGGREGRYVEEERKSSREKMDSSSRGFEQ